MAVARDMRWKLVLGFLSLTLLGAFHELQSPLDTVVNVSQLSYPAQSAITFGDNRTSSSPALGDNAGQKDAVGSIHRGAAPTGVLRYYHHNEDYRKFLVNDPSVSNRSHSLPSREFGDLPQEGSFSRSPKRSDVTIDHRLHHQETSRSNDVSSKGTPSYPPQGHGIVARNIPVESGNLSDTNIPMNKHDRDLDAIQSNRKSRLRSVCNDIVKPRSYVPNPTSMPYLLYDDLHKVIYCMVPKVASTNWLTTLVALGGRVKGVDLNNTRNNEFPVTKRDFLRTAGIGFLHELTTREAQKRLKEYFSFMFVRDPYERLLSAFNDKFVNSNERVYYQTKFGAVIASQFRAHPTYKATLLGNDVTFPEFIKYVSRTSSSDEHWRRYTSLCSPCHIDYDYIGKMETLEQDTAAVLRRGFRLNVPQTFPRNPTGHLTTRDVSKNAYRNVSRDDIAGIKREYANDFLMFNYDNELNI